MAKKPPEHTYKVISERLRQCKKCNKFITGSLTNFGNHLRTHNKIKKKYVCPGCDKLYMNKHYVKKHAEKQHNIIASDFKRVSIIPPPIEPITPWIPPFEARPRFQVISAPTTNRTTTQHDEIQEMTATFVIPEALSPLPATPIQLSPQHTYLETSESDVTICLDERTTTTQDQIVFIYSVYGIFN